VEEFDGGRRLRDLHQIRKDTSTALEMDRDRGFVLAVWGFKGRRTVFGFHWLPFKERLRPTVN
jgi:hypothetical protein